MAIQIAPQNLKSQEVALDISQASVNSVDQLRNAHPEKTITSTNVVTELIQAKKPTEVGKNLVSNFMQKLATLGFNISAKINGKQDYTHNLPKEVADLFKGESPTADNISLSQEVLKQQAANQRAVAHKQGGKTTAGSSQVGSETEPAGSEKLNTLLNELQGLINQSQANPSPEITKKIQKLSQEIDQIKQSLEEKPASTAEQTQTSAQATTSGVTAEKIKKEFEKEPIGAAARKDTSDSQGKTTKEELTDKLSQLVQKFQQTQDPKIGGEIAKIQAKLQQLQESLAEASTSQTEAGQAAEQLTSAAVAPQIQKAAVSEYMDLLTKYLVGDKAKPNAQSNILATETKLAKLGFSEKQIFDIQQGVRLSLRQEIMGQFKDTLTTRNLAQDKSLDFAVAEKGVRELATFVRENPRLGGRSFGGFRGHLQGMMDEANAESFREIRYFTADNIKKNILRSVLLSDEAAREEIHTLLVTGNKAGLRAGDLKGLDQFKEDIGLNLYDIPSNGMGAFVNTNSDNPQQQQKNPYEPTKIDEKDVLMNQLRAMYMQRIYNGNLKTFVRTELTIRKLKGGLVRLGVFNKVLNQQLKQEALISAQYKTVDKLKETLEERATLYDLSGAAFTLNENSIKSLLKNAQRLGIPISDNEFAQIRDKANTRIYEVARRELETVEVALGIERDPALDKKQKILLKLLDRLCQESDIFPAHRQNESQAALEKTTLVQTA